MLTHDIYPAVQFYSHLRKSLFIQTPLGGKPSSSIQERTGPWTEREREKHINDLELLVALRALQSFNETVHSTSVEFKLDNKSAVSYINKLGGSKSKELCGIALQIAHWCEIRNLSVTAVFIPGSSNTLADSRIPLTAGDWKLDAQTFSAIQAIW